MLAVKCLVLTIDHDFLGLIYVKLVVLDQMCASQKLLWAARTHQIVVVAYLVRLLYRDSLIILEADVIDLGNLFECLDLPQLCLLNFNIAALLQLIVAATVRLHLVED